MRQHTISSYVNHLPLKKHSTAAKNPLVMFFVAGKNSCYWSIFHSVCNKWWMVWHFSECLFVCFTEICSFTACMDDLCYLNQMRRVWLNITCGKQRMHSHWIIKCSSLSLTLLSWALLHCAFHWHHFISASSTRELNLSSWVLQNKYLFSAVVHTWFIFIFPVA